MTQDPAGILNRIAELQSLCSDAGISRAVATGDPFKVYRALVWARLMGRLGAHRRTLDQLIRHRRAFARPLKGAPWLGRVNGFGATFVGSAEAEPDGSRIATHCIVALFVFPLFPLGAYVVAPGEKKVLSSSWRIFARVPLSFGAWAWRRAVALGAVACVACGALIAFHTARHHDLHIVNGFAKPLRLTVGPASLTLPPGERKTVNLPVGTHAARAESESGDVVDEGPLRVEAGNALLVWDVAGAAPIVDYEIIYTSSSTSGSAPKPRHTIHCERRLELKGIDYAFQEEPKQLSMPKGELRAVRHKVEVGREKDVDGAFLCGMVLGSEDHQREALAVLETRARLAGWDSATTGVALDMALEVGLAEAERVIRTARDARKDDTEIHREYQYLVMLAGRAAEVRDEYRRRAEAAPDSPQAQYLYVRTLRPTEQAPRAEALLESFPKDPNFLRLVAAVRAGAGDWSGADRAWRLLLAQSPDVAAQLLEEEVSALVATSRSAEALKLLQDLYPKLDAGDRREAAVLYTQVAALSHAPDADALLKRVEKEDGPEPLLRLRAGLPVDRKDLSRFLEVVRIAPVDPGAALTALSAGPLAGVRSLDTATWALLYGEALRTDAAAALKVLGGRSRLVAEELDAFRKFVKGEAAPLEPGTPAVIRAAAELVRARNTTLPAKERVALVAQARSDDHLGTAVTRAAAAWASPAR